MLYNIPQNRVNVLPETTIELTRRCRTCCLKDSTNSVDRRLRLPERPEKLSAYTWDDFLTLPFFYSACGVVSVQLLCGRSIKRMTMLLRRDPKQPDSYTMNTSPFQGALHSPNPTCVKHALSELGLASRICAYRSFLSVPKTGSAGGNSKAGKLDAKAAIA